MKTRTVSIIRWAALNGILLLLLLIAGFEVLPFHHQTIGSIVRIMVVGYMALIIITALSIDTRYITYKEQEKFIRESYLVPRWLDAAYDIVFGNPGHN